VKLRKEVERISALHPLDARCFSTKFYGVGDRGLHRVHAPDPTLVEAHTRGDVAGSSEITLERYLGLKQRSVRAATDARGAELDGALLEYARSRKVLLEVLHRFYGEPGLRLLQEAYDTPQDRAVLATLAGRIGDAAQPLAADARTVAEMQLLVSEPTAFVPCVARARMTGAGTRPPLRLDTAAFEIRPSPGSPKAAGGPRRVTISAPDVV
jgi:hypothetical protein